jgi:dihydroflavonol-4-reductase
MTAREVHEIAANATGVRPPRFKLSMPLLRTVAYANDLTARMLRRDLPFTVTGLHMAALMSPLDHTKAERELGWKPVPVEEAIRRAAEFFARSGP